ncbi:MAG: hypothetical protein HFE84_01320 [Lachnospiraceae bacterium]|nr:hypothetical protein [Lachnospiraceae bacterium]
MYKEDARFREVLSAAGGMVAGHDTSRFNEKEYRDSLAAYTEEYRGLLEKLQAVCADFPEDVAQVVRAVCTRLVEDIAEDVESPGRYRGLNAKALRLDTCKMVLLTYVTPAVFKMGLPISELFNESLHDAWVLKYPKEPYEVVTEEMIAAGFGRKWYQCYITQAACMCLGKSDDCSELNAFRKFRDTYLRACPDGETLIAEYYKDAPAIVTRIQMSGCQTAVYQKIWETYLAPCLADLDNGRFAACKERYTAMVRGLKKEWLGQEGTV